MVKGLLSLGLEERPIVGRATVNWGDVCIFSTREMVLQNAYLLEERMVLVYSMKSGTAFW
jgi:hypothetical protein